MVNDYASRNANEPLHEVLPAGQLIVVQPPTADSDDLFLIFNFCTVPLQRLRDSVTLISTFVLYCIL